MHDLFGTVPNEGAGTGILVITWGYGTASFEFATGKPWELIGGSNLPYLLAEHAGIEARSSRRSPEPARYGADGDGRLPG